MLKIRSDRIAKFTQTDFEIYKPNYSTLISSHPLNDIESATIVEKKPKKIKMIIKNNVI